MPAWLARLVVGLVLVAGAGVTLSDLLASGLGSSCGEAFSDLAFGAAKKPERDCCFMKHTAAHGRHASRRQLGLARARRTSSSYMYRTTLGPRFTGGRGSRVGTGAGVCLIA